MNSKVVLLSVAVIAVGLFAMPNTLSLFSGQHTFYNGSSVNCQKCHADIYSEIKSPSSSAHTGMTDCEGCHRTGNISGIPGSSTGNYSTNITSDSNAHAAVTLECIACHTKVPGEITGKDAAHKAYYYQSNHTSGNQSEINLKGANTACVGCHTHIMINVTWRRAVGYNLISNSTGSGWNLTFSMNNSANVTNYSVGT